MTRFVSRSWRSLCGLPLRRLAALALSLLVLAGCKEELYSRLNEQEANEMVAILLRHGIAASRAAAKDGTLTVSVEETRFADAIELLKASGFPRPHFATLGEVFSADKLVSTPLEERARLVYALSQELERTIYHIDGVLDARVHVVLPTDDPLRQSVTPSSASVFIRYDKAAAVGTLVPQIKTLVANSIESLSYDKVSVVLVPVDRNLGADDARLAESLTNVAGLWVHESSVTQAKAMIYGLLALAVAGLGTGGFMLRRRWSSAPRVGLPAESSAPLA